jgi:hypothetical protein
VSAVLADFRGQPVAPDLQVLLDSLDSLATLEVLDNRDRLDRQEELEQQGSPDPKEQLVTLASPEQRACRVQPELSEQPGNLEHRE